MITAGVDEVGRGCLAGPVVSAAVILKEGIDLTILKDSKKISFNKREKISETGIENLDSTEKNIENSDQNAENASVDSSNDENKNKKNEKSQAEVN